MKFSVTKESLLEGLQKTQNVVSNRTTLPVLSNVLVETTDTGIRLSTTDMEVALRCDVAAVVEKSGATTLPARRLLSIVRELPSSEIQIETDTKNVSSIRSGQSFFKIFGLARDEFPAFPTSKDARSLSIKQSVLKDGLRKTSYAISMDETRYVLNGILFSFKENTLKLVATDGRRLALFEETIDSELAGKLDLDFIVPTKAINELERLLLDDGDLTLSVGDNLVSFELNGSLLVSKLVDGNYPNYKQVIPSSEDVKEVVVLEREAFHTTVRRVSLLSNDKTSSIRLNFTKNNIEVTSNTPEIGEAKESIAVAYRGRDFSIAFNPDYLMDPLKALPNDEVHLHLIDEMSPGVLKINSGFLYVIMPMRVSA
ncbi:MAG: DNA polymerase III subunit beta [Terrimicrobiaceae bacterium]|nr:DNA polymerase III subunit beta [Terrimicrobiaceae bacterium]